VAFDTPLDAWYVWVGLVLISGVMLGIVFELPTEQPPDAGELVDTAEFVAAAGDGATATVEPTAEAIRTDGTTVELKGDGDVSRETMSTGIIVPIKAAETDRKHSGLKQLLEEPTAVPKDKQSVLKSHINTLAESPNTLSEEWLSVDDRVTLRGVTVNESSVILLGN